MESTYMPALDDAGTVTLVDLGGVRLADLVTQDKSALMEALRRITAANDATPVYSAFSSAM